jgi:hypothetical protein
MSELTLLENNMEIREFEMSDDAFIEMVGTLTPEMTDEDIMAMIDEIEADESARIELADHAMNFEV